MDYFNRTVDDVFSELGTSDRGLGDGEAAMRLIASGENKLNEPKKQSVIIKFLKQFTDVMVIVLIAAAVISAVIGVVEKQYEDFIDVGIIMFIVVLNAVKGTVQESNA